MIRTILWVRNVSKTFVGLLGAAFRELGEDRDPRMAPALAFYAFFSLAPLFALIVGILGWIIDPIALERQIRPIIRFMPTDAADWVVALFDGAIESSGTAIWIGLGLALVTGSGIFLAVQGVLNDIFHVPRTVVMGVIPELRRRLIAFAAALAIGTILLPTMAVNAAVQYTDTLVRSNFARQADWLAPVLGYASPLVSVLLLVALFAMMFRYMTAIRLRWRAIMRGAVFTSVLFITSAFLIGRALGWVPRFGTIGAVGAVAVVLVFAYLLGEVFVFGAEFTKVYADYLAHGDIAAPSHREHAREQAREQALLLAGYELEPRPSSDIGSELSWRRR